MFRVSVLFFPLASNDQISFQIYLNALKANSVKIFHTVISTHVDICDLLKSVKGLTLVYVYRTSAPPK